MTGLAPGDIYRTNAVKHFRFTQDGPTVRVTRDRGTVLERDTSLGPRQFLVTHPGAVLRTPEDARIEAFAALVADLRVAAQLIT